jgi:hypothetical protein
MADDNSVTDSSMTQVVRCRPVPDETEIQIQTNTCGDCIRRSATDIYKSNNINNFDGNKDHPSTDGWPSHPCLL